MCLLFWRYLFDWWRYLFKTYLTLKKGGGRGGISIYKLIQRSLSNKFVFEYYLYIDWYFDLLNYYRIKLRRVLIFNSTYSLCVYFEIHFYPVIPSQTFFPNREKRMNERRRKSLPNSIQQEIKERKRKYF